MNTGHRVSVLNDGCRRRGLDAARLVSYFQANGCVVVDDPRRADTVLLVTCAYRQDDEDRAILVIEMLKELEVRLIVVGCLSKISPTRLAASFGGETLATEDLGRIDELFPSFETPYDSIADANLAQAMIADPRGSRSLCAASVGRRWDHPIVRISTGCNRSCAYCAIRFGVGKLKSKPLVRCLGEIRSLALAGHREIEITAEDTGSYGVDIGSSFEVLVQEAAMILTKTGCRLNITALNPLWLVKFKEALVDLTSSDVLSKLTCPQQTGSPRLLKALHRYPHVPRILEALAELRRAGGDRLHLTTHIICGMPWETAEDRTATETFLKTADFDRVIEFQYSPRFGTPMSGPASLASS